MTAGSFRFDRFTLDTGNRQLCRDGAPVELNARYLDALALLVREQGRLVSKERFHEQVWRGVPVTDEALTQCIRTLRRQLGDSAASPRFIETVPKHGYRFVAPVIVEGEPGPAVALPDRAWPEFFLLGGAGTIGAGAAGLIGGLLYGFVGASQALQPGIGAVSVLLVLLCVTLLMALIGGAGVAFGMAAPVLAGSRTGRWVVIGGAAGGLIVGAVVKLLGLDAFDLLIGQSPGNITGAPEGLVLGAAVGLGSWVAERSAASPWRSAATAAAIGGVAGAIIPLLGGRLMAGSLALLAESVPGSRLHFSLLGEGGFGLFSRIGTGVLEGALFAGCIVGAMAIARRRLAAAG